MFDCQTKSKYFTSFNFRLRKIFPANLMHVINQFDEKAQFSIFEKAVCVCHSCE